MMEFPGAPPPPILGVGAALEGSNLWPSLELDLHVRLVTFARTTAPGPSFVRIRHNFLLCRCSVRHGLQDSIFRRIPLRNRALGCVQSCVMSFNKLCVWPVFSLCIS